ncbi:hypothetical protein OQH61_04140 [Helicobacter sp. MIT 21-1697]|uniref:hypothetical protein n=1 Tax=Helicobacter sp. MIT 21-1697 TaxID=2993733 RepID=UPI00224AE647|nr:hypothetical protein [Helicobacter sp. MIT 21-1697]MCX2716921.1 hypothetical protein [Helicobacter sp. MIT 21-1697]
MNSPSENLIAHAVFDEILSRYARNPYVVVGYGKGGLWQEKPLLSTKCAIKKALEMIRSRQRLHNLVLFAPLIHSLKDLAFLHTQGIMLDIYVGQNDENASVILDSCAAFGVVRFYKNISFCDCVK